MSPASDNELAWQPAWRIAELVASRELSPVEVVDTALERIERLEPTLSAFITVSAERAREQARAAERALAAGESVGPLAGVPVSLKDEVWTEGIRTTGGSLVYESFVPDVDGTVTERLRRAGAIVVGKNTMPEFAAFPRSKCRLVPESVNPWDTTRISGASSGGSAACVAAGMTPIAIGSDGGGSIRIPASLCGVIGLHPTAGRVPARGSFSYSPLASMGPLARDVRDAALLLQVISGPDPADPTCLAEPAPDFLAELEGGVAGMRIGVIENYEHTSASADVLAALADAAAGLEESGAGIELSDVVIEDVRRTYPFVRNGRVFYGDGPVPYTQTEEFRARLDEPATNALLCPYSQDRRRREVTPQEWNEGLAAQAALMAKLDALFARYDVLVTPTMPGVAPVAIDGWASPYGDAYHGTYYTSIVNFAGLTALSYPAGFSDGLPVGVHVIGRACDEATVLRVTRALELARPWTHRPPLG